MPSAFLFSLFFTLFLLFCFLLFLLFVFLHHTTLQNKPQIFSEKKEPHATAALSISSV